MTSPPADALGHDIHIISGFCVCMKCCYFARERDGLLRQLGKECAGHPMKGDNAGRVRRQRRDLILRGLGPQSRQRLPE
eukprot:4086033-Pyramimonas_sp.AAC.1